MRVFCVLFILLLIQPISNAQNVFTLQSEQSSLIIKGTSSVHDWESVVEDFSATAVINTPTDQPIVIESFSFTAKVKSISSGKRIMDRKTYGAFNEKDYPNITFTFSSIKVVDAESVTVTGTLSMAGKESVVDIDAAYSWQNNVLQISGSHALLMTTYGMEPPTAMMGAMKTGDEVIVDFNFNLTK